VPSVVKLSVFKYASFLKKKDATKCYVIVWMSKTSIRRR